MAYAETSTERRAAAEVLFKEAGELYKSGSYAEACKKLEKSQRIDPATGTLLNLARCYEKVGRSASAWIAYVEVASQARRSGQTDREQTANDSAKRLAPTLARLTIEVPKTAQVPDLEIKRNGEVVPPSLWNVSAPVDPGSHTLEASASGKQPWSKVIEVAAQQQQAVTLPVLAEDPKARSSVQKADRNEAQAPEKGWGTRTTLALAAGSMGIASLVVGTGFGIAAKSDLDEADKTCGDVCTTKNGFDHNESAHQKATLSTVLFAAGGAFLATGAVLWFTAPSQESDPQDSGRLSVGSRLSAQGATLMLRGIF